jgi:nicotinate-nucleotide pyrophosphorylase (carboxylating)
MIMLKDNHIDFSGGIRNAVKKTKEYLNTAHKNLKIEVETRSINEVEEVIEAGGVDIIMLDNMSIEEMILAVKTIDGKMKTEASGNINETNIVKVASCGVDYISVGALTHTVKSLDLSLKTKL